MPTPGDREHEQTKDAAVFLPYAGRFSSQCLGALLRYCRLSKTTSRNGVEITRHDAGLTSPDTVKTKRSFKRGGEVCARSFTTQ